MLNEWVNLQGCYNGPLLVRAWISSPLRHSCRMDVKKKKSTQNMEKGDRFWETNNSDISRPRPSAVSWFGHHKYCGNLKSLFQRIIKCKTQRRMQNIWIWMSWIYRRIPEQKCIFFWFRNWSQNMAQKSNKIRLHTLVFTLRYWSSQDGLDVIFFYDLLISKLI